MINMDMIEFNEWFDPCNLVHIEAIKFYEQNGHWPKGFIPEYVTGDTCYFRFDATFKMAKAWMEYITEAS
jgi:hypothetical protein